MTDALSQTALDVVVNDLREAAKLLFDGLCLPDQHFEHTVFNPLGENEIVAMHLVGELKFAVDTPVALLNAARIPRQVESGRGLHNRPGN